MLTVALPLHEEHAALVPRIEALRETADLLAELPFPIVRQRLEEQYDFLAYALIPHARAEEMVLYPEVARIMGAPDATVTMSRDHVEVAHLTAELDAVLRDLVGPSLTIEQLKDLRRLLYGLYTLVKVHFAKEEDVFLPILEEHLTAGEAERLFGAMHSAADEARGQLV